jgi:hypothetical protein
MSTFKGPDWKPAKRVKNPKVMKSLHVRGVICVLCGNPASLHHVYPKGQGGDDVFENLVGLCGSGTTGHHGSIENGDVPTRIELGAHITADRPDIVFYLQDKLGEEEGREWLRQRFYMRL